VLTGSCLSVLLCMLVAQMLAGTRQWAQLMALNASDPDGWAPGHSGPTGEFGVCIGPGI
jgi:hypothetical protein